MPVEGSAGFVWDNEGPPGAPQTVTGFSVAAKPVTVAEFYRFAVVAEGYIKRDLWQPDDWAVLSAKGQVHRMA